MSEVFSILLHNRQRYEQGKEGLWFSLPTTTEKLQEALREIGISADNPQDFFLYDYRSPQERPIKLPRDLVLSADVDELNFLAARLDTLDAARDAELTRGGSLEDALAGLAAARDAGFSRTKVNCVLMGGVNDVDVPRLAELARTEPIDVRFIELMPMGPCAAWPTRSSRSSG